MVDGLASLGKYAYERFDTIPSSLLNVANNDIHGRMINRMVRRLSNVNIALL